MTRTILVFNDQPVSERPYLRREVARINRNTPGTNARIVVKWGGDSIFNVVREIDGQLARDLPPSYDMSTDWDDYHESNEYLEAFLRVSERMHGTA